MNEQILSSVEKNILRINRDIKKKKGIVGADKINSLAKLLNAYNRLLVNTSSEQKKPDNNYYDTMEKNCLMKD